MVWRHESYTLLQVINRHVFQSNHLRTVDIVLVRKNADRHTRTRDIRELDGARETLVTLRVVVLETNLELDGLDEVALLLAVGLGEELLDGTPHA